MSDRWIAVQVYRSAAVILLGDMESPALLDQDF